MILLLEYARERLVRASVLAAALLVTAGAQIGRGSSTAATAGSDLVISLSLVISFRVWDDVMDLERDRVHHPGRVAVRAASTASLSLAAWGIALAAAGVLLRARGPAPVLLLAVFGGVLATSYAMRRTRSAAGERILLFKYAVFTLVLIGSVWPTPRAAASALGVYLAACVYEWRHDRQSPVFSFGGSR
jgi:4-hydroxybenzoate polyprenyltransferase